MAYAFQRSGYVSAQGDANSLPDGDWAIGGWAQFDDVDGDGAPTILGQDPQGTAWFSLGYYESGYPEEPRRYRINVSVRDDAGLDSQLESDLLYAFFRYWQHVLVQRSAGVLRFYRNGQTQSATAPAHGAVTIASANVFGQLAAIKLAEWAKWDRALRSDEIRGLARGFSPRLFPRARRWCLPMVRELREIDGPLSLGWTDVTIARHPRIFQPAKLQIGLNVRGMPPGWTPPYRVVAESAWHTGADAGSVWHTGAVAGRTNV